MVRAKGLEPSRFWHWLLRPTCLPFHHARNMCYFTGKWKKNQAVFCMWGKMLTK